MPTTHVFESPHGDGADDTQVRPSNWNDDHDVDLSDYTGDVGASLTPAGNGYFNTLSTRSVSDPDATLELSGSAVGLYAGAEAVFWSTAALYANDAGKNVGTLAKPWQHGYFSGTVYTGQVNRDDGSALRLVSTGGALEFRPTNTLAFAMTTGNFRPTSPGTELGRSADPFSNGYFSDTVYASAIWDNVDRLDLGSTGAEVGILGRYFFDATGFRPFGSYADLLDIGHSSYKWRDGYFSGHLYAQGASFAVGDDTPTIELQRDKGSALLGGERLGAVSYMGHDGTALVQGAEMRATPSADWSATSHPTRILFSTTDVDETVATPRVRIDEHGDMTPHTPGVGEDGYDLGSSANPWAQGWFSGTVNVPMVSNGAGDLVLDSSADTILRSASTPRWRVRDTDGAFVPVSADTNLGGSTAELGSAWFSGTVTAAAFNPPVDVMATLRAETDTPILDYLAAGTPNPHQTKGAIIALLLLVRTLMHIED